MARPVPILGAFGNVLPLTMLDHGTVIGVFLDLSTDVEGQVSCLALPGSTQPTVITTFNFYKIYANLTPITASSATGLTITVGSTPATLGLFPNAKIGIQQTSGHGGLGEVAVITSISGDILTFSFLLNTYAAGDFLYVIDQTPLPYSPAPSSTAGTYSASTPESACVFPGPSQYFIGISNGDSAQNLQVAISLDLIEAFV